ncbi:MAG: hypothetical protein VW057_10785, partial [Rhodospirillaceae bacterium]
PNMSRPFSRGFLTLTAQIVVNVGFKPVNDDGLLIEPIFAHYISKIRVREGAMRREHDASADYFSRQRLFD